MAGITVFGYAVPMVVVLVAVALVIGLALATMFYITMGWSVYRSVRETRREQVRPALRDEMLDRLFAEAPNWEAWVANLSDTERSVLETLLDEYLRELDGRDADQARRLGDALGIPERAGRRLDGGGEYDHLEALTWLTLLERPGPYLDSNFEPRSSRERAAVVTLLHRTDRLGDIEVGVSMLLEGATEQFTVFGQNTLYRLSRREPMPLLRAAADHHDEWPEPLLAQVMAVCTHLETSVRDQEMGWLTAALETENEAIRAAAANALGSFGWQPALRDQVFLERATGDPSPRVRGAVYEMLAAWGDESALSILLYALVEETHPRALTRGTTALVGRRDRIDPSVPAVLGTAWDWSSEHEEYDRIARGTDRHRVRG